MKTLMKKTLITITLTILAATTLASNGSWPPPAYVNASMDLINNTGHTLSNIQVSPSKDTIVNWHGGTIANQSKQTVNAQSNPMLLAVTVTVPNKCTIQLLRQGQGQTIKISNNKGNCTNIENKQVII